MAENTNNNVPPEKTQDETVELSKADLKTILGRIDKLEKSNDAKDQELLMLRNVANQGALAAYERRNAKGELISKARLSTWKTDEIDKKTNLPIEKIILSWRSITNISYVDQQRNIWVQDQTVELALEDGSKTKPIQYTDFDKNHGVVVGDVLKKTEDEETGAWIWTVELKDGRKLEVDRTFVNQ